MEPVGKPVGPPPPALGFWGENGLWCLLGAVGAAVHSYPVTLTLCFLGSFPVRKMLLGRASGLAWGVPPT